VIYYDIQVSAQQTHPVHTFYEILTNNPTRKFTTDVNSLSTKRVTLIVDTGSANDAKSTQHSLVHTNS